MRLLLTALLACGLALPLAAFAAAPAGAQEAAATDERPAAEQQFLDLVNQERTAEGLGSLVVNAELAGIARSWSDVMAAEDHLHHNPNLSESYTGEWQRLGENVGYTRYPGMSVDVKVTQLHRAFMESPGHRANVLQPAYNQVGIGVTLAGDALWVTLAFLHGPLPAEEPQPEVQPDAVEPAPPVLTTLPTPAVTHESVAVSQAVFGAGTASRVVIARADAFADALGGAALAGHAGPVLLTPGPTPEAPAPGLAPEVLDETLRALQPGGTAYLLGGVNAVSDTAEGQLRDAGVSVRRLAGSGRVETAALVASEVVALGGAPGGVLLARADDWADAVTGGAWAADRGVPVLLTRPDELHAAAATFLAAHPGIPVYALGGPAALAEQVVADAGATRVAGADRTATAVAVATQLWGRTAAGAGDAFVVVPGYATDGWAWALAHAPRSAAGDAPQLLVGEESAPVAADYLRGLGYTRDLRAQLHAASAVPDQVVAELSQILEGP